MIFDPRAKSTPIFVGYFQIDFLKFFLILEFNPSYWNW